MARRSAKVSRTIVPGPFGEPRAAALLQLDDGDTRGWGEASPLESYAPDSLDEAEGDLRDWAASWERSEGFSRLTDLAPSARCAIDTALLDLDARKASKPIHTRLAEYLPPGRPPSPVPVCALVTPRGVDRPGVGPAIEDVLAETGRLVAEGFHAVKFKVGTGPAFEEHLDLLSRVRKSFPDLEIRLDANGMWSGDTARRHLADLAESVRPDLVEQPVGTTELLSFRFAAMPIAADESLRLDGSLPALAEPGACQAVVLKPMILGGIRPSAVLAAEAHALGLGAIVSHTFGGPISHAAACELALAVAAAAPTDDVFAAGLAGHEHLPQMEGARIVPAAVEGHGVAGLS